MTRIYAILFFIMGVAITYAVGALVAWDLNPAHWGWFWRLWCLTWAIVWGGFGAVIGTAIARYKADMKRPVTILHKG